MKRIILGFLAVGLSVPILQAREHRSNVVSLTNHDGAESDNCGDHFQMRKGEFATVVSGEESRMLPNQPLNFHAEKNGGIQVTTWDKPEFSVKLCKQVAAHDENKGRRILDETTLAVEGPAVSVRAPQDRDHSNLSTLLLVKAPKDASVSLTVQNGGASLYHFSGTAEANTVNGGISLNQSTGKLTVHAQNGGVSIRNCGGEISVTVANGGVSIVLPERWEGKGLEAHTQNGGVSISVPQNFSSGLEVTTAEYVSVICRGTVCQNAQKTAEKGRHMFRLGSGEPQIRATTKNGGVVIKDLERENAEK
jgi:DUF4097 and DUF4098 domain-containing protein YvlB